MCLCITCIGLRQMTEPGFRFGVVTMFERHHPEIVQRATMVLVECKGCEVKCRGEIVLTLRQSQVSQSEIRFRIRWDIGAGQQEFCLGAREIADLKCLPA